VRLCAAWVAQRLKRCSHVDPHLDIRAVHRRGTSLADPLAFLRLVFLGVLLLASEGGHPLAFPECRRLDLACRRPVFEAVRRLGSEGDPLALRSD